MRNNETACDKRFSLFVITGVLLVVLAVVSLIEELSGWGFFFLGLGLFFAVMSLIFLPFRYTFDSEGVSIHRVFFQKERYLWENIYDIEVGDDTGFADSLFDLFFSRVFKISGRVEGKARFYMEGYISKSRRTKRLIEKYWDGEVTGYIFSKAKGRKKKKEYKNKALSTVEIEPLEAETRRITEECVKLFVARLKQSDLRLVTEYLFLTGDFDELLERPKSGYTYIALFEIARQNETDEEKTVQVSVDLVNVRISKYTYRGVVNPSLKDEILESLADVTEEIEKNGISAYCESLDND